ncbi:MAG: GH92 family glycosyl hydrolase [Clostridia bacterium]|nr:GH92 family glycosyl hydrolase [Clostridia bacterium]
MLVLLRKFISLFIALQMLFGSLLSGGDIKVDVPEYEPGEYGAYVDPFIGTGGIPWMCGMLSPAACAPFGFVRVGPDTSLIGGADPVKTNTSGYFYEYRHITGFSMSRLSGTGARDYEMFRVTPTVGDAKPGASSYSHKNETASPGYYAVYLPDSASLCEMTATSHAAVERYTFKTDKSVGLYFNACAGTDEDGAKNAWISVDASSGSLTAYALITGAFSDRYGGLPVYCYAEWDAELTGVTAHTSDGDTDGYYASGDEAGAMLRFAGKKGQTVTLKIGISFISAQNAKENLYAEIGDADFDAVRQKTADEWENRLSCVKIEADDETKTVFYTALYHAMIMPSDFTEADGRYLGFDRQPHAADGFTYRTDISLWDTARNVHSLYTLVAPDVQNDCINSLLRMYEQGGALPRWPSGAGYSGSMFGNPGNILFAESLLKGLDFDVEEAYEAVKKTSSGEYAGKANRDDAAAYEQYGYVPDDLARRYSVSETLEYAWEDAAAAVLAKALGKYDEAAVFERRAQSYKNLWDDSTKYFRPKNSDGSWGDFYPLHSSFYDDVFGTELSKAYCEGSARHWRWFVPHDTKSLIELFGGSEVFVRELEKFMRDASLTSPAIDPGTGYWIGNQHDIQTPYMFNDAGRPDLTQKWVRWTLKNRFSADIDGLDGNDDGGTTSSWYVFSAMGFYPIVGTDRYWIGSPCVDEAVLSLPGNKTLTVRAVNQSEKNIYVSSVSLNGQKLAEPYIDHASLMQGGELTFVMSDCPAK